ncbi:MAG: isoprenylcysteine carboxylmethyltransferase family protein [Alphaproteobacteria bacterium]|jgi:protein-S-isoprenylcysteine O-methyltransferase Ste14|nr:isoprenylcysteine carboxylmethyltransferase family protein [Alphaproteobacteria bacterium]MBT4086197.1 isoprenylcysteine carboxylmethyltransferase family protein [Alphaproteobacteria bacterium]MBT4543814.1 isoprenylcysteine carboxylmethyltransferase family protein [Alphaproteobacteria bacterium]MBT7744059.1 isoprenylcysteine carboxylmethyltransferase family protein [Alphaproteobacteria bacterium]
MPDTQDQNQDHQQPDDDHADVRFPPPFIYISFLVAGILSDSPWIDGQLATMPAMLMGAAVLVIAGMLALKSVPRHRKEGSNVEPWKPTTKIISDGVYGRSRNPIYVAMALLYIGISIAAGSLAALVYLVPCLLIIRFYVIGREEIYLERKFGEEYVAYKGKVRRWF